MQAPTRQAHLYPLTVRRQGVRGGVIVGVCSTGDVADPGSDIHAGSNYANLTASRSWIRSVTGV